VDIDNFELNPLIQRKARNGKAHKRNTLDLDNSLARKSKATVKRLRVTAEREADEDDISFHCR